MESVRINLVGRALELVHFYQSFVHSRDSSGLVELRARRLS